MVSVLNCPPVGGEKARVPALLTDCDTVELPVTVHTPPWSRVILVAFLAAPVSVASSSLTDTTFSGAAMISP
ncbi:hypothetical protein D3C71_1776090 [compost metagenome]